MSARLDGTVALVTGASSGIGEATALALAARISDSTPGAEPASGPRAAAFEADITDGDAARSLVQRTVSELGRLDILVNNAGVMLLGPALDAPVAEWERMVTLNVQALLWVAHAALPHLLDAAESSPRGVSDMVNVSSTAGRQTRPGSTVYNLTKHGVGAFSDALRQEVTRRHLRVALVEPGATATELRDHLRPEFRAEQARRFEEMEPLTAQDVAESIAFIVTRPRHVAVNEVLLRPTEQV